MQIAPELLALGHWIITSLAGLNPINQEAINLCSFVLNLRLKLHTERRMLTQKAPLTIKILPIPTNGGFGFQTKSLQYPIDRADLHFKKLAILTGQIQHPLTQHFGLLLGEAGPPVHTLRFNSLQQSLERITDVINRVSDVIDRTRLCFFL